MAGPAVSPGPAPDDLVEVGRIVDAHGIRGWVKVQPYSADAQVLLATRRWWLKAPDPLSDPGVFASAFSMQVVTSRFQGKWVVAQFTGLVDRNAAEALRNHTVWASRAEFPAAQAGEYYWVDLIGCDFFGERDGAPAYLGRVAEVFDNGAHAVLRIACGALDEQGGFTPVLDARGRPRDILVPFVQAHVPSVDLTARRVDSNWPAEF
ncbi:MAG: ribosome maturation factor RimM [Alcaligenaceae bacterium]|nr:ribosome maturation factor RimM [Alcaligenaceae bacterium]